jgi:hypothetical protein
LSVFRLKTDPIARIRVYTDGKQPALDFGLSDFPNGMFLSPPIAYAAATVSTCTVGQLGSCDGRRQTVRRR